MHPSSEQGGPPGHVGTGCSNTELSAIVISELRDVYGIKYRKEKKQKSIQVQVVVLMISLFGFINCFFLGQS